MKKRVLALLTALACIAPVFPASVTAAEAAPVTVSLSPANASPFNNGEFEGWGTSMGWWGNRIGYSDKLASDAAKLFYSEEGLGLDIVRYNVGGGDNPTHNHVTRSDSKLPCFAVPEYNEDGTVKTDASGNYVYSYVWDEAGYDDLSDPQTNVLKKIKEQNDNVHIEGYTNSPPWFMTETGCSGGGKITLNESGKVTAIAENLAPETYGQFADFLADVTKHFEEIGLPFDSYSPMNEPNPAAKYWGELSVKQEGNHVAPGEHQSQLITTVRSAFDAKGIDTIIAGLDETSLKYSKTSYEALTAEAKAALGRFDTHSYSDRESANAAALKQTAIASGKNFWMSEVDHGGTSGTNPGNMGSAFDLANYILGDMNVMQPSAWVMWDILDFHKDSEFFYQADENSEKNYSEKNNALNQNGGIWGIGMVNHDTEEIELTQKYYGYGQFTKYIKPGMTIIESASNCLAAYDKNTGEIVIVAVNQDNKDIKTKFDLRAFTKTGAQARAIRTSGAMDGGEHWARLDPIAVSNKQFTADLKANSITTFVIGTDAVVEKFEATGEGLSYKYTTSGAMQNCNRYLAVYNADKTLNTLIVNKNEGTLQGDFTGCTFKLMIWDGLKPVCEEVTTVSKAEGVNYMNITGSPTVVANTGYDYNVVSDMEFTENSVKWSVSDESAATVTPSSTGNGCSVTAKKGGTFTLKAELSDGTYTETEITAIGTDQLVTIVNKKSGLGLETKSKGITSGSLMVQWADRGLDTAAWKLAATDDGHFNIINKNADMLLISNADSKPAISSDALKTDDAAKWDLINHGGYYEIKNVKAEKSLNVSGQSVANGGSVILYEFGGGDNELWSLNIIDDPASLEHVVPEVVDYSKKYAGTGYTFVKNVDAATNDFNSGDLKGFTVSGTAALTTDGEGESVLGVQALYSNKDGTAQTGSAALATPIECESGQTINIAFDLYCSNSGGTADFALYGASDAELVKMVVSDWDKYTMTVAGTASVEATGAKTYLRNGVNDKVANQLIANGAHFEIYYTPSTGAIKLTLKNNTNSSPEKVYEGTVANGGAISKLAFNANYTTWAKPMYVDNLVTNIVSYGA